MSISTWSYPGPADLLIHGTKYQVVAYEHINVRMQPLLKSVVVKDGFVSVIARDETFSEPCFSETHSVTLEYAQHFRFIAQY